MTEQEKSDEGQNIGVSTYYHHAQGMAGVTLNGNLSPLAWPISVGSALHLADLMEQHALQSLFEAAFIDYLQQMMPQANEQVLGTHVQMLRRCVNIRREEM